MAHTPEILTSVIIAIGDFNPAIFSADWLEANGLIGKADADEARAGAQGTAYLVSHQVTAFETKWFALQVLGNQFSLTSKDALSPAFRDLAVGIFQLVPHTPASAVGLNFVAHFKIASEEDYFRFGDTLAPKTIWNALYPNQAAGVASLTMLIEPMPRGEERKTLDEKRISLQPSSKFKYGVMLSYNDHHNVTTATEQNMRPAEMIASIVETQWDAAWDDSMRVFNGLLSMALEKEK